MTKLLYNPIMIETDIVQCFMCIIANRYTQNIEHSTGTI